MSQYTLEDIYNCTREQYLKETGMTAEEMIKALNNEIMMLRRSADYWRDEYRSSPLSSADLLWEAELLQTIEKNIQNKLEKVIDLEAML